MNDISNVENVEKNDAANYLTARDETGGKIQIPMRRTTTWGYQSQSTSRFEDSGVRNKIIREEMIPVSVDPRLKPNDVITIKNELGSSFHYQVTEKPRSASHPKNEVNLISQKDIYLKRLSISEYNTYKWKEVPASQKEKEIKMGNQMSKNLVVEIQNPK